MIKLEFTEEEKKALHYERYHHPHPRVQQKMEVLWLKSFGLQHKLIATLTGISVDLVTKYLREYQNGGIEELKKINFYRPKSELENHSTTIKNHLAKDPPSTVKEAMYEIEKITGLKRSETQIRKFLHKLGLKPRKVGMVPAKADVKEQKEFLKKTQSTP